MPLRRDGADRLLGSGPRLQHGGRHPLPRPRSALLDAQPPALLEQPQHALHRRPRARGGLRREPLSQRLHAHLPRGLRAHRRRLPSELRGPCDGERLGVCVDGQVREIDCRELGFEICFKPLGTSGALWFLL